MTVMLGDFGLINPSPIHGWNVGTLTYVPVSVDATGAVVTVGNLLGAGLTDLQLRASPVPVSVTGGGDASAANQVTGNNSLASIDGKTPALGQALAANSVPVILPSATITTLTPPAAITGFATSAKQDTSNSSLSSLDSKFTNPLPVSLPAGYALDSSLTTLNAKDFATAAKQDTGNSSLSTIATNTGLSATSANQTTELSSLSSILTALLGSASAANTSTAVLAGNAVFTGTFEDVKNYAGVILSVYADVASAVNGLEFQWSSDGTNVDRSEKSSVLAATGRAFNLSTRARYFRVKYTNGADGQAAFRLNTFYLPAASGVITKPLSGTVTDDNFAQSVQAVTMGRQSSGTFLNLLTSSYGELATTDSNTALFPLMLQLFMDMRTELRIQNTLLASGLNCRDDLDAMRRDGYYSDPLSVTVN